MSSHASWRAKQSMVQGMKKIQGGAMAWQAHWKTEALPILQRGCIPALGDGLVRFLAAPRIAEQVARGMEKQLAEGKTNPYDTHPPPRDRIAAMEKMTGGFQERIEDSALSLLREPEMTELRWSESVNPKLPKGGLHRSWAKTAGNLSPKPLKILRSSAREFQTQRECCLLPSSAPGICWPWRRGWYCWRKAGNWKPGREMLSCIAETRKWMCSELLKELAEGKIGQEARREKCKELGIAGAPLCPRATEVPSETQPGPGESFVPRKRRECEGLPGALPERACWSAPLFCWWPQ